MTKINKFRIYYRISALVLFFVFTCGIYIAAPQSPLLIASVRGLIIIGFTMIILELCTQRNGDARTSSK
jgi:hypothetical protein